MVIKFWGTRGSIPVPGKFTVKYGGNTPCVQITAGNDELFIFDAGTGIRELGNSLMNSNFGKEINIFISHTHWDHIQGLPFFSPFSFPEFSINIYSKPGTNAALDHILDAQMHPDFFPVNKEIFQANINYFKISEDSKYDFGELSIETIHCHHSKGTLAFKIRESDKSVVYMTDNEIYFEEKDDEINPSSISKLNNELIEFCLNCDYLIHDCTYSLKDYRGKAGWGHSNNVSLAHFSSIAKVKNAILFHYDQDYSDKIIDELFAETKSILKNHNSNITCVASREQLEIVV